MMGKALDSLLRWIIPVWNMLVLLAMVLLVEPGFAATPVVLMQPGALPMDVPVTALRSCPASCEIIIEGTIAAKQPVTLVLRADDNQSAGYASRVNDEKNFAPGAFKWRILLSALKTSNGRFLDRKTLTRMILFLVKGEAQIRITSFRMEEVEPLPAGAKGLSFGGWDTPLPRGFERVLAADKRIEGQPFIIRRPAPDPLIAGGLRGIAKLHLEWPKGRARVSLWTEDPGEWELLPFPLSRQIIINGTDALHQNLNPPQWLAKRYLLGADQEPKSGSDAWSEFGQHRGGLVSIEVEVGDNGILIEQSGDSPSATFLSAALVEPAGQRAALDAVLQDRRAWYAENFALGPELPQVVANHIRLEAEKSEQPVLRPKLRMTLTPGTGARASLTIASSEIIGAPEASIRAPKQKTTELPIRLWAAQRHLDRVNAGSNLLAVQDERLRYQTRKFPISHDHPRRYEIWVDAPAKAEPGHYDGEIRIGDAVHGASVELDIEVLPVVLPGVAKPAGYYLDEAPHLTWFPWPGDVRRRQIGCDLATLTALGINGNAPALSTPIANRNDDLMADAQIAAQNANGFPWMAYAPATRAIQSQGLEQSTRSILDADKRLLARGYERLIWSIADEPSNPDVAAGDLAGWVKALRSGVPGVRLAAHLNNRGDRALVPLFDTVMVNAGYGIDIADIEDIKSKKVEPWLYNTGKTRFTAGLWLWRTAARHYIQWHARMPTADPFDPTDGREGDVQMFFPSMELCPKQPDMSADVLAMAEGVVDQRWLSWLDSRQEPEAKALVTQLKSRLDQPFEASSKLDDKAMTEIREQIVDLARRLN